MATIRSVSRMRTLSILSIAAASALLLAGCTVDDGTGAGSDSTTSVATGKNLNGAESFGLKPADSVTKLVPSDLKGKTLTVALYNDGAPQDYIEDGKLVGIQADFAQAVSELSGLDFQFASVGSFDSLIPGLQSKRYDAAFVDFGATAERQKIVDLVHQFDLPTGFGVVAGSSLKIDTAEDLCGTTAGLAAGSYFIEQVQGISKDCTDAGKKAITVQAYPSESQSVLAVTSGRTQVYATSSDQLAFAASKSRSKLDVQKFTYKPIPQAIGVPKDSKLGPVIVAAVKEMIEDGSYAKILKKWDIETAAITADDVVINPVK